jgi:hypothetical protein
MSRARGLFEKALGSGVWWIRYADASGPNSPGEGSNGCSGMATG